MFLKNGEFLTASTILLVNVRVKFTRIDEEKGRGKEGI